MGKRPTPERGSEDSGVLQQVDIPLTNEIKAFFHCKLCLDERPSDVSPRDWAQLEVGWTVRGIQVWCKRHECNVMTMDFEGHKHPASLDRLAFKH